MPRPALARWVVPLAGAVFTSVIGCASAPQASRSSTDVAEPSRAADAVNAAPARPRAPSTAALESAARASEVNSKPKLASTPTTVPLTDPLMMQALEAEGLALHDLLPGNHSVASASASSDSAVPRSQHTLAELALWRPVFDAIRQEVARVRANDPNAGVSVARYSHRVLDVEFLRSKAARFELVGVVNRLDRVNLVPDSCGEIRLVYRLGYVSGERASRLPLTLALELTVPRPAAGCIAAAERWREPAASEPRTRARWLTREGPLQPSVLRALVPAVRVVINAQIVRWPSTVRPDLGGHAEYLLRAFRLDAKGVLQPEGLENTIDAAALQRDPIRRQRLLAWLTDPTHLSEVAGGFVDIPDEFLAERAISVSPRGSSRLQNRPFSALFKSSELSTLDLRAFEYTKTPEALLRRLDQLTCQGCHQARSVAGFHLLGEDPIETPVENALATAVSPHVIEDQARRTALAGAWLRGETPDRAVPFAEHASAAPGLPGAHCGLGSDPNYAGWTCAPGLKCVQLDGASGEPVGRCSSAEPSVGEACELGVAKPALDAHKDRITSNGHLPCPNDDVCNRSNVGFPGGMCTARCGEAGALCGSIAVLDPFNACLGRGGAFLECIRGNVTPAGLRACDSQRPCRDDYVCAKTRSGGACIPPYFVFQLRVDGHPVP